MIQLVFGLLWLEVAFWAQVFLSSDDERGCEEVICVICQEFADFGWSSHKTNYNYAKAIIWLIKELQYNRSVWYLMDLYGCWWDVYGRWWNSVVPGVLEKNVRLLLEIKAIILRISPFRVALLLYHCKMLVVKQTVIESDGQLLVLHSSHTFQKEFRVDIDCL